MQDVREGRYPTDMDGFLHVVADARSSLERVIEGRTEEELTELRDAGGWAVKDHLYHLAVWERDVRYLLQGLARHEGAELNEQSYAELDVDSQNAIIFEKNKVRSLEDVMRVFHAEHQAMVDHLSSITWEDLNRPYSHYAPKDNHPRGEDPVLYWIFGDTADHFNEHQEWIEVILQQTEQNER